MAAVHDALLVNLAESPAMVSEDDSNPSLVTPQYILHNGDSRKIIQE